MANAWAAAVTLVAASTFWKSIRPVVSVSVTAPASTVPPNVAPPLSRTSSAPRLSMALVTAMAPVPPSRTRSKPPPFVIDWMSSAPFAASMVEFAPRVTRPRSMSVAVVDTAPEMLVVPGLVALPVVASPPA